MNSEYVSFDIFDTLVSRSVSHSVDIFKIVENYALANFGMDTIDNYAYLRQKYETNLREKTKREITLDDIYAFFTENSGSSISDKYKHLEEDMEVAFAFPNQSVKRIYEDYLSEGKKF